MKSFKILGVRVDSITSTQALNQIEEWSKSKSKHYITTPNVEILMAAQSDPQFLQILNNSDLNIADSPRLGWAAYQSSLKNPFKKLISWPLFLFPQKINQLIQFDTLTGTDLVDLLVTTSSLKVGFLGGEKRVAEKYKECLLKQDLNIKILFADSTVKVTSEGDLISPKTLSLPELDILFVALGHGKQEKFIAKHLKNSKVKIMMGVGGALDYLSGEIPRAPKVIRSLGFEWLYRLIVQPWRIKRFGALIKFIFANF